MTDYEIIGGSAALTAIVRDFVGRVTRDIMIGFHFDRVDKERLVLLETEFAAEHLGGPEHYTGRPLHAAHAGHRILGGHFNRRLRLLEQTLEDHGVDAGVRKRWVAHNEELRAQVTDDGTTECND